jgi:hypothetical protein
MKHICDTRRDYIDAMTTSMQGDIIYCTEKLWNELFKSRPERLSPEDQIVNVNKMVSDSPNSENK